MKVAVYDTYVPKRNGEIMHFDVLVPDGTRPETAVEFAMSYLSSVGQAGQSCGREQCQFCHVETAAPEVENSIQKQGFHIIEMKGCRDE